MVPSTSYVKLIILLIILLSNCNLLVNAFGIKIVSLFSNTVASLFGYIHKHKAQRDN